MTASSHWTGEVCEAEMDPLVRPSLMTSLMTFLREGLARGCGYLSSSVSHVPAHRKEEAGALAVQG